ncbi:DUF86 domain-containing protein [bacterium]|nr:DUF86 domain-containing protein [bacterium]
MDKERNKIYLKHILDAIEAIESYVAEISEEDFSRIMEKQDAVIRRLEIIGEAGNKLSEDFKKKYALIEWSKIISMRNFLIHQYFGIDLPQVWDTIVNDLPKLKKEIEKILK